MAEAVVASSFDKTEFRSYSKGNLTIRDWSWSQHDADAGRCMGSSACTCILHSWGSRFLTTGCLPAIDRHDVATMVAEYDSASRPVDGTIAKEEWAALSHRMPSFKYFDAEGDATDPLTVIVLPEDCVRALLNFCRVLSLRGNLCNTHIVKTRCCISRWCSCSRDFCYFPVC